MSDLHHVLAVKPDRIALVGPLPPPAGGMANQTEQLARLLEAEGIAVELVQVNPPYWPAAVGRIRGLRAVFRFVPYVYRLWRAAGRNRLFHVMANSGWSWHLLAAPAVRIAALRGVPVVVNYRGGEAEAFLARAARSVRRTLSYASALVTPSGFLEDVFRRFGMQAEIVPNIIDLDKFQPPATPISAGAHIVVARNLEPLYDIPTALRAFALVRQSLPDARMSIAGSGPDRERLEVLASSLGVTDGVRFTGRLNSHEMADLYRSATVLLNPSLADNMPNSLLEALATGLPVVSTDVGGVPYLVKHDESALLVDAGSAEAMADAIRRLVRDSNLRRRLVDQGRALVRQYAWSEVKQLWLGAYARALAGKKDGIVLDSTLTGMAKRATNSCATLD